VTGTNNELRHKPNVGRQALQLQD